MTLIKWSDENGQVRLGLPSDLDLAMAQPLLDSLRAGFGASGTVIADASAVERVSTACVQALLVAARHAAEHNHTFAIAQPSEVLTEACEDLGLAPWLKQWSQA
ncbi:STAS domain-containing protein [Azospirillum sp. sgz302134]